MTISNINVSYLYQGFSGFDMINNYEVGFKKPIMEILYYPFILSVISNIVRYYSKNIEVINSDKCIHRALNIITVIKQLIDSEKISIKKDGYFAKIINGWELDNIETLAKLQKYDHHTLLSDYYDIEYEDLYYGNILKLDEKVKQKISVNMKTEKLYSIVDEIGLFYRKSNQSSPFNITFSHQFFYDGDALLAKKYVFLPPTSFDLKVSIKEMATIEKVKDYFNNRKFNFDEHKLTIRNRHQDVYNVVNKLINNIVGGRWFSLEMKNFVFDQRIGSEAEINPNSSLYPSLASLQQIAGYKTFIFNIKMFSCSSEFSFNLQELYTMDSWYLKIEETFDQEWDFNEHKLSIVSTEQDVYNFVFNELHKIISKDQKFQFILKHFKNQGYNLMKKVQEGKTSVSFEFLISKGMRFKEYLFKAKNILTVSQLLEKIKNYFKNQIFDFNEHQLTRYHKVQDANNFVKNLIQGIIGETIRFELKAIDCSLDDKLQFSKKFKDNRNIKFKIKILDNETNFIFKFKNIELNPASIANFFQQEFDFNLNSQHKISDVIKILNEKLVAQELLGFKDKIKNFHLSEKYQLQSQYEFGDINMLMNNNWAMLKLGKTEFRISFSIDEIAYTYPVYLKNIELTHKHLVAVIKNFFVQEYDWNIFESSSFSDILEKTKVKLQEILGEKYYSQIEISLKDSQMASEKINKKTEILFVLKVDGTKIFDLNEDFKIKLINISSNNEHFVNKVIFFFNKVHFWNLTTDHNGWFVFNQAKEELKKFVDKDIDRIEFKLKHIQSYELKNSSGINNWDIILKIDGKEICDRNLKIKVIASLSYNELLKRTKAFFDLEHDWNINCQHNRQQVVLVAYEKLKHFLWNQDFNYNRIEIKLQDLQSANQKVALNKDSLLINLKIDVQEVSTSNNKIKLINIGKIDGAAILDEIENLFAKEIGFTKHQLTTSNTRKDAYDLAMKWIKEIFPNVPEIELLVKENAKPLKIMSKNKPLSKTLTNQSKKVKTGDYFYFDIIIDNLWKDFNFKAINIAKNPDQGNVFKVKEFFAQEFDFWQHNLSVNQKGIDVYHLANKWIKEILGNISFSLELKDDNSEFHYITNNSEAVIAGDCFEFTIFIGDEETDFKFKIKNVIQTEAHKVILTIKEFFNQEFDFWQHKLTVGHTRLDAYQLVKRWILNNFSSNLTLHLKMKGSKMLTRADNIPQSLSCGCFNIKKTISHLKPCVNAVESISDAVPGLESVSKTAKLIKVGYTIAENLNLISKQESNANLMNSVSEIGNIVHNVYTLIGNWSSNQFTNNQIVPVEAKDYDSRFHNVLNNSKEIVNGDYFEFDIAVGNVQSDFRFKVKNVNKNVNEILFLRIKEFFDQEFDFSDLPLTIKGKGKKLVDDIGNLVKKWVEEKFVVDLPFKLVMEPNNLYKDFRVVNKTSFKFNIFIGGVMADFKFKVKNIKTINKNIK
ncbi:hypothetical protein [Spiroplasma endosymbiont of Calodromius spilotus]|uniref:hypothetical protein n=1 Tax=Spiroplasma endosymbiont of Calodromius spilotus TaxID=3077929 RepID=UPI0031FE8671